MDTNEHDTFIRQIIGAAYEVSNSLGCGFLEKVYERAMTRELTLRGLQVRSQVRYTIEYKGHAAGDYIADLVVADQILVELKCVEAFSKEHLAVCLNYLRASQLRFALLINFQKPKVEWKRIIL